MKNPKTIPCALTIAGSDSGGGAGIQADLKTFAALGVHGASAITCITAQNWQRIRRIHPCPAKIVRNQIEAVLEELSPAAIKTGMLYSAEIVGVVVRVFSHRGRPPLVVDPVMVSTSGRRLLEPRALKLLSAGLLPLAALVTPNLHEAGILLGETLTSIEDMRAAAREIRKRFGCAALVKGGHLSPAKEAVDIFYDGTQELILRSPFIRRVRTHGTGCAYSAAITAFLARGCSLPEAVRRAKRYITQAIAQRQTVSGRAVLNHRGGELPT